MTSTFSSAASERANRAPRSRETPVTRTTRFRGHHGPAARLLARATALDPCALEQLAMLLLRHPLATLLDDRTHCVTPRSRDVTPVPDLITAGACRRTTLECYRASLIDASQEAFMCPELVEGHPAASTSAVLSSVEGLRPHSTHKRLTAPRLVS